MATEPVLLIRSRGTLGVGVAGGGVAATWQAERIKANPTNPIKLRLLNRKALKVLDALITVELSFLD
jgi:hypothetical protein